MNGIELIKTLSCDTGYPEEEVREILDSFRLLVVDSVSRGEDVSVRHFGTFSRQVRKSKVARDIKRQMMIVVPEKNVPKFRPAAAFRNSVNEDK